MCEDPCLEVEEIEDLTRLEYVLSWYSAANSRSQGLACYPSKLLLVQEQKAHYRSLATM